MGGFSCFYANIRGMRTKLNQIKSFFCSEDYDFIFLTETWLNDQIYDDTFLDDRYKVFRADRCHEVIKRGGGTLIAIRKEIVHKSVLLNSRFCESTWCEVSLDHHKKLLLGNVYIRPALSFSDLDALLCTFEEFLINYKMNIIITGDFNIPELFNNASFDISSLSHKAYRMLQFFNFLNLKQHNSHLNSYNRILDYVLSNLPEIKCFCVSSLNFPIDLHHPPIEFFVKINYFKWHVPLNIKRCYKKGDYMGLCKTISNFDWSPLYSSTDANYNMDFFNQVFNDLIDFYIPKKRDSHNFYFPFWFSDKLKKIIRRKLYHHKQYIKTRNILFYNNFINYRRLVKAIQKIDFQNYIKNMELNLSDNPKEFWSFIKTSGITKRKSQMDYNSSLCADDFSVHFSELFGNSQLSGFNLIKGCFNDSISIDCFNNSDIISAVKELKIHSSIGYDNIPSFIYKGCVEYIAAPLCYILNCSIKNCIFPNSLKLAKVIPIFKNGSKDNVNNYRPISVLHTVARIFERCVYKKIVNDINKILVPVQHGFLPGRSTETNLLTITDHIANAFENQCRLDVVYFDLSKAFDKVDHSRLLFKMYKLGFSYNLVAWFESFIKKRTAYVKFKNNSSNPYYCNIGVPQGSILAPLLFNIYIDDLGESLEFSHILCYADDCKIFRNINSINDCILLQKDINNFVKWCRDNKMDINMDKCSTVSYSKKSEMIICPYYIEDHNIKFVDIQKDLGIIFASNGSFHHHIENVVNKAFKIMGAILRHGRQFSSFTKYKLFLSLVLPILEYGSVVWNPSSK